MVDVLKALVDALCRFAPALAKRRSDKKLQKIGVRLFLIYVHLVETLMTADRIIDELEYFAQHSRSERARDRLSRRLGEQAANVDRLLRLLHYSSEALILLDASCYARLVPLLELKYGFLSCLQRMLSREALPLGASEIDFDAIMAQASGVTADEPEDLEGRMQQWLYEHKAFQSALDTFRYEVPALRWEEDKRATVRWPKWEYEPGTVRGPELRPAGIVKQYLKARKPRDELARLRDATSTLGATLAEHFSVEDVLLEVDEGGPGPGIW